MKVINFYQIINKKLPFTAVINKLIIDKYYDEKTIINERRRMYQLEKVSNLLNEAELKELAEYRKFLKMEEKLKFEVGKYYGWRPYFKVIKRTKCFVTLDTGKKYKIRIESNDEYIVIKDMYPKLDAHPAPESKVEAWKDLRDRMRERGMDR